MDEKKYKQLEGFTSGSTGIVFKYYDLEAKKDVYVKFQHISSTSVKHDVNRLKKLKHPNIISLSKGTRAGDIFHLVFEYMPLNLKQFMEENSQKMKDPQIIKSFLHQILSGVQYLHSLEILHQDLNPHNLLIDASGEILQVAALGLAFKRGTGQDKMETLPYKAPEIIMGGEPSAAADMWAVGCIFAEMVTQRTLFPGDWVGKVILEITRIFGLPKDPGLPELFGFPANPLPPHIRDVLGKEMNLEDVVPGLDSAGFELLTRMLTLDPTKRITAQEAVYHAYFEDI